MNSSIFKQERQWEKFLFFVVMSISFFPLNGQSPSQPNIIVYLADDLGYLDISVHGASIVQTPVLQKLSLEGLTFNNAFVTSPSCAPSRASLLTGLMPASNGAETNHSFPAKDIPYLIDNFKKAGYRVLAFGKVAHYKGNQKCGFDYHHDEQVNLYQNIKAYLDTSTTQRPTLIFVGDRRPHVSWTKELFYAPQQVDFPSYFIDTKSTREHRSRYYTDITGLDHEMGKVLHYLNGKLGKNTISLFTSDHGAQWPFGKWNLYDAGIRTPLIIKWPGIISANTRTDAMVSWIDILPTLLDMANIARPSNLDGKSFKSIVLKGGDQFREVIYTTHTGDGKFNIYPIRSIRTTEYKLILNLAPNAYHSNHSDIKRKDGAGKYWDSWNEAEKKDPRAAYIVRKYYQRPKWEFYDLRADPNEQLNLIDELAYQTAITGLQTQLKQWMKDNKDEGKPHREPYIVSGPRPKESDLKK